jgi:hypothetical protein
VLTADFISTHRVFVAAACGITLWISLSLILQMWLLHRQSGTVKKLFWSIVLLIPFAGWVAYGAWFDAPDIHNNRCPNFPYRI